MILNAVLPSWFTSFTLTIVLGYVAYEASGKAAGLVKQENEEGKVWLWSIQTGVIRCIFTSCSCCISNFSQLPEVWGFCRRLHSQCLSVLAKGMRSKISAWHDVSVLLQIHHILKDLKVLSAGQHKREHSPAPCFHVQWPSRNLTAGARAPCRASLSLSGCGSSLLTLYVVAPKGLAALGRQQLSFCTFKSFCFHRNSSAHSSTSAGPASDRILISGNNLYADYAGRSPGQWQLR